MSFLNDLNKEIEELHTELKSLLSHKSDMQAIIDLDGYKPGCAADLPRPYEFWKRQFPTGCTKFPIPNVMYMILRDLSRCRIFTMIDDMGKPNPSAWRVISLHIKTSHKDASFMMIPFRVKQSGDAESGYTASCYAASIDYSLPGGSIMQSKIYKADEFIDLLHQIDWTLFRA